MAPALASASLCRPEALQASTVVPDGGQHAAPTMADTTMLATDTAVCGVGVGYGVERRAARRAYYGGYGNGGYGMAAAGAAGAYAGAAYNAGSNSYPARATFTQGYMPAGYYGPVCDPRVDRLCQ